MSDKSTATVPVAGPSRAWNVTLWVLQVLAAAGFLFSGVMKFVGPAEIVALYDTIGIGQWFRHLTGVLEVIGAVVLLVPRRSAYGALLLAAVMVGAVVTHLFLGGSSVPALAYLVIAAVIAWGRRGQLPALRGRARG